MLTSKEVLLSFKYYPQVGVEPILGFGDCVVDFNLRFQTLTDSLTLWVLLFNLCCDMKPAHLLVHPMLYEIVCGQKIWWELMGMSGAIQLMQMQEEMLKRQLEAGGDTGEVTLESYLESKQQIMLDSLWKLNVADIELTLSHVCQSVQSLSFELCGLYIVPIVLHILLWVQGVPPMRGSDLLLLCCRCSRVFSKCFSVESCNRRCLIERVVERASMFSWKSLKSHTCMLTGATFSWSQEGRAQAAC